MIERLTSGWRPFALLSLLCLALYLPGIASLPPVDRDEARYVQATRQMLETGDLLRIRFQDEARNKKPAGIYWLQSAVVAALSDAESTALWPYRLPSLAGALIAVLLTFVFGRAAVGPGAALVGASLLAASLGLTVEAHFATTDAVQLAAIVAAQAALGMIYFRYRRSGEEPGGFLGWPLVFWLAEAIGILIKGPVAPLLALLTLLTLAIADRDVRWLGGLRPLLGLPLLLLVVGPWLIAISLATQGAFLQDSVGHDFLGKLIGGQEAHGAPPGYYLLTLPAAFWPGSLFLAAAVLHGWRERRAAPERFLIAWALPFWVMVELVPTKLPHYLLPAYPALALMVGSALAKLDGARRWSDALIGILWAAVTVVLAGTLVAAPIALGSGLSIPGLVAAAALLLGGPVLFFLAWRRPNPLAGLRVALLAPVALIPALGLAVPSLDGFWLSRAAAEMVARQRPGAPIVSTGYSEPSLVFLLGTRTRLVAPELAAESLAHAPGTLALVEGRQEDAFRRAMTARGQVPHALGRVSGLDYSNGKRMVLTLYSAAPG